MLHNKALFGLQVMYDRHAVLSALEAGFIDADDAHISHDFLFARGSYIVSNASPQAFRSDPQFYSRLRHRQVLAQRQCQCFEPQSETVARSCPRYIDLRRLAARDTRNAGYFGVMPCFVLEKIEMMSAPARQVVNALRAKAAGQAITLLCQTTNVKIDAPPLGQNFNLRGLPLAGKPRTLVNKWVFRSIVTSHSG
ncbi:hypothetical protein QN370_20235 [Actimicrobium sp. CCI2.3]|nr:hypothetical protein [Actimicrobium sp. CCI2.3]MEB0024107.1 hypothetical protein [Actimicrobium sp. CCI2.3]